MKEVELISASNEHTDLLYEWANESETRKNAFHTEQIEYDTHVKWFANKLADSNCFLFIGVSSGEYIGQVRVDIVSGEGTISYSIDKNHRGQGLGTQLLLALENLIEKNNNLRERVKELVALVKYENIPSQKCFEKLEYGKKEFERYIEYRKYIKKRDV